MKTPFSKSFASGFFSAVALIGVCMLFSLTQAVDNNADLTAAGPCCRGYNIALNELRQFMLDSMKNGELEGGVFSKNDLLKAVNNVKGDSVYLMTALINCIYGQGNGLIMTSPATGELIVVSKNPYCAPCPGRACCPQRICATVIRRNCINYKPFSLDGAAAGDVETSISAVK